MAVAMFLLALSHAVLSDRRAVVGVWNCTKILTVYRKVDLTVIVFCRWPAVTHALICNRCHIEKCAVYSSQLLQVFVIDLGFMVHKRKDCA